MKAQPTAPTTLVIFGATGNLSQTKLLPALLDLYAKHMLPKHICIVGYSRREQTDNEFREFVSEAINKKHHKHSAHLIKRFLKLFTYSQGKFENLKSYKDLTSYLNSVDSKFGTCSNKLYYLAAPPDKYNIIFKNISSSGLAKAHLHEPLTGWTRILVEKPFGKDLKTAQALDKKLGTLFKEEQIFRIDHYLAKETVQNLLIFRFANKLFEPLWNKDNIDRVEIKLLETKGIEERGAFYEDVGALRDVGQNHILQMLAFIAMDGPSYSDATSIRNERAKILASINSIPKKNIKKFVERGQYKAYRSEKKIADDSDTETYFRIIATINNARWKNVPFILESGKRMGEKKSEITIYFKETVSCLCPPDKQHHQNVLTFRIQPDEGISILFWAKKPGFTTDLEPKLLSFAYKDSTDMRELPDAYERILFDCIRGDQILFASTNEVEAAWKFITPILKNWKSLPLKKY